MLPHVKKNIVLKYNNFTLHIKFKFGFTFIYIYTIDIDTEMLSVKLSFLKF